MLKFSCCDAPSQLPGADTAALLRNITRGFEKECLRVQPDGGLSQRPHPQALGSKLTHPWITTDYAEALLEFITPPSQDPDFPLAKLRDIHRYTVRHLGDEALWAGSMPCVLGPDSGIALADYGASHEARFKHVYREGLGLRYGRHMQTIAGVHYNWSLPEAFWQALHARDACAMPLQDFISDRYFGLIRNFLRYSWLIPYLFGASPAICRSFLQGRHTDLPELFPGTVYGPYATSLRMSDLGYQNRAQDKLQISFNSLADYTVGLEAAIRTPDPYYEAIGVKDGEHWKQLNANLLQIENEFYAGIRPKRIGQQGERPALALKRYGVQYLEVRTFDLNPLIDIGIAPEQSTFADAFLLMCLFRDSPPITAREQAENEENKRRVVNRGRQPDLQLLVHNHEQSLQTLAHELFDDMLPFVAMLDGAYGGQRYRSTLDGLRPRIDNPELTPSAQILAACRANGGYFPTIMQWSKNHKNSLLAQPLDDAKRQEFEASVATSLQAHAEVQTRDSGNFDDYVAGYFA